MDAGDRGLTLEALTRLPPSLVLVLTVAEILALVGREHDPAPLSPPQEQTGVQRWAPVEVPVVDHNWMERDLDLSPGNTALNSRGCGGVGEINLLGLQANFRSDNPL